MNTIELLERLVAFPTISRESNLDLIGFVEDYLGRHGVASTLIHDETGRKANLYATIGPRDRPGVMLSGHTDIVPVEGQEWSSDPFRLHRSEGRLHGRGTADMKGFLASALAAARDAATRPLATPLHLAFSHDEEVGCVGVRRMIDVLEQSPNRPRFCIVGEPTSMAVATGHKGKTALRASCIGREAHSALAPKGINAIHLAADFIGEIRAL
ncbi:MAG TPA: M20/M25/M40 family metallo-hydrolase, partial [Paracoccaceae bacterium]|nr:M20/M25/M40 family metallo-hydrolase [Paracoccaceae bacterium]